MEAVYDRIAAVIRHGHGSRLIAVLVPESTPLLGAISTLQRYLREHGVTAEPTHVKGFDNLSQMVRACMSDDSRAIIAHGLEALPSAEREAFLRASSFARTRLKEISVPVILMLGAETWSWVGMELPDLARWVDGPFWFESPRPQHVRTMVRPVTRSETPVTPLETIGGEFEEFERIRNVDIYTPFVEWLERGGVMLLGGPTGVGLSWLSTCFERHIERLGRPLAHVSSIWLDRSIRASATPTPQQLDAWLSGHLRDAVVVVDRSLFPIVPAALARKGMDGIVRGPTRCAFDRASAGTTPVYVPPVHVVEPSGAPVLSGIEAMARMIRTNVMAQLHFDLKALLPEAVLHHLVYASGGLPGLLWQLVAEVHRRAVRLGVSEVTVEFTSAIIQDFARLGLQSIDDDDDVERVVRDNVLDFELESQGIVLFYVIDGELRTLRHPLLTLGAEGTALPIS